MSIMTDQEIRYIPYGLNQSAINDLHNRLCEIVPDIMEDSQQPEWTTGKLDEFILTMLEMLRVRGKLK